MPAGKMVLVHKGRLQTGKPSTRKIANKALRLAKSNVTEMKAHDITVLSGTQDSASWRPVRISTPAQGDAGNQRDGDIVQNLSIAFIGHVTQHATAVNTRFRLVCILDRQNNGVFPTRLDVFTLDELDTFMNFNADNRKRFKVLIDRTYYMGDATKTEHHIQLFKRLSGNQRYRLGTDADAAAGKNSIWVYVISDEATNVPTVNLDSRFVFRDV